MSVGATGMEGCMLLEPDSPAASFASHCTGQDSAGRGEKRQEIFKPSEMRGILLAIDNVIY